jgi:hypothetical protein
MAVIPLTQGYEAIVDDMDATRVLAHKWYVRHTARRWFYGEAKIPRRGRVRLHRFILDAPPTCDVDHVNGNGLDNRRSNLRLASNSQNGANRQLNVNSKSGLKGVSLLPSGRYHSVIRVRGVLYRLGTYDTREAAACAYDRAAIEHFGEYARTNFPKVTT